MISRHYHQTNLSACERNSMVTSFSNTVNPLLFEKKYVCSYLQSVMFPIQSDNMCKSDTRPPVLSHLVHHMHVRFLSFYCCT